MNKREQFGFMRANREKQRQVAAYGRMLDSISRHALGIQSQGPGLGIVHTTARQQVKWNRRSAAILKGEL